MTDSTARAAREVARQVLEIYDTTDGVVDTDWLVEMCGKYPHKILVAIDARDGQVSTDGWKKTSETTAVELAVRISSNPVARHRTLTLNVSTAHIGKKSWICISLIHLMRFAISLNNGSILTMLNALIML